MIRDRKRSSWLVALAVSIVAAGICAQDQQPQKQAAAAEVSVNDLAAKPGDYLGPVQLVGVVAVISQGRGFVLLTHFIRALWKHPHLPVGTTMALAGMKLYFLVLGLIGGGKTNLGFSYLWILVSFPAPRARHRLLGHLLLSPCNGWNR